MVAQDITACLEKLANRQDFLHYLDALGLDADFGREYHVPCLRKCRRALWTKKRNEL